MHVFPHVGLRNAKGQPYTFVLVAPNLSKFDVERHHQFCLQLLLSKLPLLARICRFSWQGLGQGSLQCLHFELCGFKEPTLFSEPVAAQALKQRHLELSLPSLPPLPNCRRRALLAADLQEMERAGSRNQARLPRASQNPPPP